MTGPEPRRWAGMNAEHWRRHAHRWSVWTRLASVAAFALIVYARVWVGWWAFPGVGGVLVFLWLNTRIFPPVASAASWEARAIFGERVWLEGVIDIPAHHKRWARRLTALSVAAAAIMILGLILLDPWASGLGAAGLILGQLWLLDRMNWLFLDLARAHGEDPLTP